MVRSYGQSCRAIVAGYRRKSEHGSPHLEERDLEGSRAAAPNQSGYTRTEQSAAVRVPSLLRMVVVAALSFLHFHINQYEMARFNATSSSASRSMAPKNVFRIIVRGLTAIIYKSDKN